MKAWRAWVQFADIFKYIFVEENVCIMIQISRTWLKYIPEGLTDNKSALFQVMVRYKSDATLLPKPMLTQFADAYMHLSASMNWT